MFYILDLIFYIPYATCKLYNPSSRLAGLDQVKLGLASF